MPWAISCDSPTGTAQLSCPTHWTISIPIAGSRSPSPSSPNGSPPPSPSRSPLPQKGYSPSASGWSPASSCNTSLRCWRSRPSLHEAAETALPRHLVVGLHHVRLAMPPGGEQAAREFYAGLLEMHDVTPSGVEGRGSCWFRSAGLEILVGVESPFVPAAEAHPGILSGDLDRVANRLEEAGYDAVWDPDFPGYRRLKTSDPFGNRLEFLQPRD